ncbi:hypothetical protein [Rhodopirellula sp. MGV]|uniref:hypothetical protein n=1 Tax=Rhodopirellula sp. MGV TaxID=2023130 RepID=UPI000B95FB99|nr:hypothetical protein [Rhodopirellula sp. MGV]OYP30329.1 hypothetical protein CGZ80_22855 [Rhodopirellula sp. MGV]PNY34685.1 hypothetical protein C2E31_22200 [Rhodopirellula baltica]
MHIIRLRRPWVRWTNDIAQAIRTDAPDTLTEPIETGGDVHYQRRFNCPTGLTPNSTVVLSICPTPPSTARVLLNDQAVWDSESEDSESLCLEIQHLLQPSNTLLLVFSVPDSSQPDEIVRHLASEIELQIHEAS